MICPQCGEELERAEYLETDGLDFDYAYICMNDECDCNDYFKEEDLALMK